MSSLEKLLAAKLLTSKKIKDIHSTDFVIEENSDKIYFLIKVHTGKVLKNNEPKLKIYKNDITSYIQNHGSIELFFQALVTSEMLLAGYLLVPIENGYLCIGGEEIYSLNNNECTCPAFLNNNKARCKHLLFKEGLFQQRARINEWKQNNLN